MIVTCPSCSVRYLVNTPKFGAAGRRVRCARCGYIWLQLPVEAEATADEQEPAETQGRGEVPATAEVPAPIEARPAAPAYVPIRAPAPLVRPPADTEITVRPQIPAATRTPADAVPEPLRRLDEGPVPPLPSRLRRHGEPPRREAPEPRDEESPRPRPWLDIPMLEPDEGFIALEPKPAPRDWRRGAAWGGVALAVIVLGIGAVAARDRVMGLWPPAARLYEFIGFPVAERGSGLDIRKVTPTREVDNGLPTLVIAGEVANISAIARPVPRLKVMLRDSADHDLQSWTFSATDEPLLPGATISFHTSVSQPPDAATGVVVTFAEADPKG